MGYAPGAAFGPETLGFARTAGIARPMKKKFTARRSLAAHRSAKPQPLRPITCQEHNSGDDWPSPT